MKKETLIIVNQAQFGYHIDSFYYCHYLRNKYNIIYLCWDYGLKKIFMPGITIRYISRKGHLLTRNVRFLFQTIKTLKFRYNYCIIKYFKGCSLLKILFPHEPLLLDIRTFHVKRDIYRRKLFNLVLRLESRLFSHISVISEGLADKLGFKPKNLYILPLGANIISPKNKQFDHLRLLYVGTLENRNIGQTLIGFSKFYHAYKEKLQMHYTIIGEGNPCDIEKLEALARNLGIFSVLTLTGKIPHNKLSPYFDTHNLGVSYIPETDYFDHQPPTKTYEYMLSGIPVIGTSTSANKKIVTPERGILIHDTPESFFQGLVQFYTSRNKYHSNIIRAGLMDYAWEQIVVDLERQLKIFFPPSYCKS